MARTKNRPVKEEVFIDRDFEGMISEGEEIECSDEIWKYYETHKDELEDLDDYARKRSLRKSLIVEDL